MATRWNSRTDSRSIRAISTRKIPPHHLQPDRPHPEFRPGAWKTPRRRPAGEEVSRSRDRHSTKLPHPIGSTIPGSPPRRLVHSWGELGVSSEESCFPSSSSEASCTLANNRSRALMLARAYKPAEAYGLQFACLRGNGLKLFGTRPCTQVGLALSSKKDWIHEIFFVSGCAPTRDTDERTQRTHTTHAIHEQP